MLVEVWAAYREGVWLVEPPKGSRRRTSRHEDFITADELEIVKSGLCEAEPIPEGEDSYSYADGRRDGADRALDNFTMVEPRTLVIGVRR